MTMSMTCCYEYTDRQRIAFYMVGMGLALCIVGCASPFWLSGKIVKDDNIVQWIDEHPRVDDPLGKVTTFDIKVGLWWYCVGLEGRELVCFSYPPQGHTKERTEGGLREDNRTYVLFIRTLMCGCLALATTGMLIVCFYCSRCCSNQRTLGYGVIFFAAGVLGFAAVFVLTFKVDVLLSLPESSTSFGWAYPVFLTGNSLILIASIILCVPTFKKGNLDYESVAIFDKLSLSGMKLVFYTTSLRVVGGSIILDHISMVLDDAVFILLFLSYFFCFQLWTIDIPNHELTGQMGAFEPLPEAPTLTICKTNI